MIGSNHDNFNDKILLDEASLNVSNYDNLDTLDLWAQSEECFSCSPWKYLSLKPGEESSLKVNSTYLTYLYVRLPHKHHNLHRYEFHFAQRGIYSLNFNSTDFLPVVTHHEGDNEFIAVFAATLFFCFLYMLWIGTKSLQKRMEEGRRPLMRNDDEAALPDSPGCRTPPVGEERRASVPDEVERNIPDSTLTTTRLRSLDTFRGITITLMIFVNYGGGTFYFFKHSPWNGLTVADLVFPWFLWIMGVSLTFSIKSQLRRMTPYYVIALRIIKRSVILFVLGIVVNSMRLNNMPEFRILGVLQRFAFCYLINALLETSRMKPQESTQVRSFF
ncbi:UNVERIFIED_CONTAM: hypothetical protein GTU68_054908 [Idotea baltica]|nr:hypothetical protein [Idotea baltica]